MAITKELLEQALQETRTGPDYCAKCVQTRNGRTVRVLAIDDRPPYPVVIQILSEGGDWATQHKELDGTEGKDKRLYEYDLVPTPRTYRNGRTAKNGDVVLLLGFSFIYEAVPNDDYCNGKLAAVMNNGDTACLIDCLHIDDVLALLAEKGLDKRPPGK